MQLVGEILLWGSVGAIAASYFVYPLVLLLLGRLIRRQPDPPESFPSVTLMISAYNESRVIRDKLENTLAIDYPADRLQVLVISDSSDDGTDEIVQEFRDPRIQLCRLEPRGGKSRGITHFMPLATGEFVVFSDANSMYQPDALRWLMRPFADPKVGYVVGHQLYEDKEASSAGSAENVYWHYEIALKEAESRVASVVGGDGAMYAIRRSVWIPIAHDEISDFVLPLRLVAQGYRGVFERRARCVESTGASFKAEFRRRTRIVNRSLTAVMRVPRALQPFHVGWNAVLLFVHKVLRWFTPFFMVGALVGNYMAVSDGGNVVTRTLLYLQLAFYALSVLGIVPGLRSIPLFYLPFYFCLSNLAAAKGVLKALRGRPTVLWNPERDAYSSQSSPANPPS